MTCFICCFCRVFITSYYANHIITRYIEEGKRRKIKMATETLIINYFRAGFTYNEIADILSSRHGTNTNIPIVVIHKVRSLMFRNFRPQWRTYAYSSTSRPPPIRASTLLAGPPSPLPEYVLYG